MRLRGEVVRISEQGDRRLVTIAVEPRSLVELVAGVALEAHLGDRLTVELMAPICRAHLSPAPPDDEENEPERKEVP